MDEIKNYLKSFNNLYCVGRNGQHRYNNMDHSMLTSIRAVQAIQGKVDKSQIWEINTEEEYHETTNTTMTKEQFKKMGVLERTNLYNTNRELYDILSK